ncbi:hypothetical protein FIBSPDRAFT_903995 [Athelia psychrophila]|uniref:Uncharacterized protein n=1 Tax=Athelia psychrophila TaxID=1759441 RepID=A0A167VAV0_9AGAM|nr:hypothetical protein FIBSPDRAFT_903995 [Fibularhizoctonia sp. CBS 109695]
MPLKLSDFSAWIECGGTELECYAIEYSDDRKAATCWIASEVGKQFEVLWSRDSESQSLTKDMASGIFIDGVRCQGLKMKAGNKQCRSRGILTSPLAFRPYTFGICAYKDPFGEPNIHEQAKKAVDHKVKLGEEVLVQEQLTTSATIWEQKLVQFTFKYRPIEVLRANDIVPRPAMGSDLAPGLEHGQAAPGQLPEYKNAPGPVNIKRENQEDVRDTAITIDIQTAPVKVEPPLQVVFTPTVVENDESEDEDADAARMRALKEELRELEKRAEIKALKKRLAELEGNGTPSGSGSQGSAKRVKRAPPIAGSAGESSRSVKKESFIIDLT